MNILLIADARYQFQLTVCMASIIRSHPARSDVSIWVLLIDVDEKALRARHSAFRNWKGAIHYLHLDSGHLDQMPVVDSLASHYTSAVYARLFIDRVLPRGVKKIIYLDVDTIVVRPLNDLWDTPIGHGDLLAAVQDVYTPLVSSEHGVQNWELLRMKEEAKYFSSGVMVIDTEIWRSNEIGERTLTFIRDHSSDIIQHDQEALNAIVRGSFSELSHVYNVVNFWKRPNAEFHGTINVFPKRVVRHYAGPNKPWNDWRYSRLIDDEIEEYYSIVDETYWRGWRPICLWGE